MSQGPGKGPVTSWAARLVRESGGMFHSTKRPFGRGSHTQAKGGWTWSVPPVTEIPQQSNNWPRRDMDRPKTEQKDTPNWSTGLIRETKGKATRQQ